MVIEYIGELIRNEVAEYREKLYDSQVGVDSVTQVASGNIQTIEPYSSDTPSSYVYHRLVNPA